MDKKTRNEVLLYAIKITKEVVNSIIPQSIDCVHIVTRVSPHAECLCSNYAPNALDINIRGTGAYSDVLQLILRVAIPDYFMFFDDFDRKEFENYFAPVIKSHIIELYVKFTQKVKEIYEHDN